MTEETGSAAEKYSLEEAQVSTHFWVCTYPYFQQRLYVYAPEGRGVDFSIRLHQPTGAAINEVQLSLPPGTVHPLELSSLLEGGMMDAGIKHAHLEIVSPIALSLFSLLEDGEQVTQLPPLQFAEGEVPRCVPLSFSAERKHLVALVNPTERQVAARMKLFFGARAPDEDLIIPPRGSVLCGIQVLFSSIFDRYEWQKEPEVGYLRVMPRNGGQIGVVVLEERQSVSHRSALYSVVS